jgi:OPA family glycerol-3-phosphate transporter-like MFS transporter
MRYYIIYREISRVGWIADLGWTGVFVTMVVCCLWTMAFSAMTLGHKAERAAR